MTKSKVQSLFLIVLLALVLAGCDALHYKQYCVKDAARNDTDIAEVKSVLANVAVATGLTDKTESSHVPKTVACYTQTQPEAVDMCVVLGARISTNDVVIDLYAGFGPAIPPPEFTEAKRRLVSSLQQTFGPRFLQNAKFVPMPVEDTNSPAK